MLIWNELVVKMFSFNILWIKKAVSHPSERCCISAASVVRLTLFSLLEFQTIGVHLFFLSHMKTMYSPWLSSLGKLMKLASSISAKIKIRTKIKWWNQDHIMWLGVFLINLMTLLTDMSEMVAVLIFVLISQTWKLISDRVIPATQFNFPSALLNSVVSFLESGWWHCLDSSELIGIRLIVLMYWFKSVFCWRWTLM